MLEQSLIPLKNPAAILTKIKSWNVVQNDQIVEINYGSGFDFPQYAALHTDSGFLRLNYGKHSGWGTSIILLPSFWSSGRYHQGAPITTSWRNHGSRLFISFVGSIGGLLTQGEIVLQPPAANLISGSVTFRLDGCVRLDQRPGEAFKPVVLSSMHISANQWDASSTQVGSRTFEISSDGWLIEPSISSRFFGFRAGSSQWKNEAPTVEILLREEMQIAGWKAQSSNPNDDNISLWAASDELVPFFHYGFAIKP